MALDLELYPFERNLLLLDEGRRRNEESAFIATRKPGDDSELIPTDPLAVLDELEDESPDELLLPVGAPNDVEEEHATDKPEDNQPPTFHPGGIRRSISSFTSAMADGPESLEVKLWTAFTA